MPGAWCTRNELSRGTRRLNTRADVNFGSSSKIRLVTEGMFREAINSTVRKVRQGVLKWLLTQSPSPEGEGHQHRGCSAALRPGAHSVFQSCFSHCTYPKSRQHSHCKICRTVLFLHILYCCWTHLSFALLLQLSSCCFCWDMWRVWSQIKRAEWCAMSQLLLMMN